MNKLNFFIPLMHKNEYTFIEKYLNNDDILLEWGSGNSTLYFSGIVKQVISIEHDKDWIKNIQNGVNMYNIKNINLNYIPAHSIDPIPCRYEQFKDYINFPVIKKIKFTKVLIDGRARKYCAKAIYNIINDDIIVIIHDFNRKDYQLVLKYYDIIEQLVDGQGIVALKKKNVILNDDSYY
jgi:hypothetical protein